MQWSWALGFYLAQAAKPALQEQVQVRFALTAVAAAYACQNALQNALERVKKNLEQHEPAASLVGFLAAVLSLIGNAAQWMAAEWCTTLVVSSADTVDLPSVLGAIALMATPLLSSETRSAFLPRRLSSMPRGAESRDVLPGSEVNQDLTSPLSDKSGSVRFSNVEMAAIAKRPPTPPNPTPFPENPNELFGFRRILLKPIRQLLSGDQARNSLNERSVGKSRQTHPRFERNFSRQSIMSGEMVQVALTAKNEELKQLASKNQALMRTCSESLNILEELVRSHDLGADELVGAPEALMETCRRVQKNLRYVVTDRPNASQRSPQKNGEPAVFGDSGDGQTGWMLANATPSRPSRPAANGMSPRSPFLSPALNQLDLSKKSLSPTSSSEVSTWCVNDAVRSRLYGPSFPGK